MKSVSKKNKNIIYKNSFQNNSSKLKRNNKINRDFKNYINILKNNLDEDKDIFHFLSKNFKLNFKLSELKKFKKFKTVAIVGMGGSILGSQAIYHFLKKKSKKIFYLLTL